MHKDRAIHNIVVLGNADLHPETKRVSPAWAPVQQTGKSHPIHLPRFLAEVKNTTANTPNTSIIARQTFITFTPPCSKVKW